MWKRINKTLLLHLLLFALTVSAQPPETNSKDPFKKKLEVLETSRKFRYPDYYASKVEYAYDFQLNNSSEQPQLEVNEAVFVNLVGAKDNVLYKQDVYFDDQSSLKDVAVRNEEGKELRSEVMYGTYRSKSVFHDDLKVASFDVFFPSAGAERSIEYRKSYTDYKFLPRLYFPSGFPSLETEIRIQVPVWLNVEFQKFNFEKFDVKEKVETKYSMDGVAEYTTHIFTVHNMDQFRYEKNAPSTEALYPHLFIIFKSLDHKGKTIDLMKDMQDLYSWCNDLCKKVENDTSLLRSTVNELITGKNTDEEKIESIFYWVQDKIRYIAFEQGIMGYQPESSNKVYSSLYGDCKGMSNLMKQMLLLAGYDARLCWIGTRDIPYDKLYPVLGIFNHMICAVTLHGKRYYLDGTEDFIALGDNAYRVQGKTVMIENGDSFITDSVPQGDYKINLQESFVDLKIEGKKLKGKKHTSYTGEEKLNFVAGYAGVRSDEKEQELTDYLTYSDKNISIANLTYSDLKNRKIPVQVSYDFTVDNAVFEAGNELYVYLDVDKEYANYYFDTLRLHDWEMDHRLFIRTTQELEIPEGYTASPSLKNVDVDCPDYSIKVKTVQKGNKIEYTREFIFKNAIIRKKDFSSWNALNTRLREIYNTPVVLTRHHAN
jgi:transglutaminase-like putative cysteine protease